MNHYKRRLSLSGIDVSSLSVAQLRQLVPQILAAKIHGISFSPYTEDQSPGSTVNEPQIYERLAVVAPHVEWIRTFSCADGHELIPAIARRQTLKTLVGVWIDSDLERNEEELNNAIDLARQGFVDILAVGNEVLLRGDLEEAQLLDYIERVKASVPGIPVGYVDAYFKFEDHPRITEACDVLLANCYPFWEGCAIEHALLYMKEMYRRAQKVANGKRVIVSETGWPNVGTAEGAAQPSFENAIKYFVDSCQWAEEDQIELFYFSSFDESWKIAAEGDVGAYWGLWTADGKLKYG